MLWLEQLPVVFLVTLLSACSFAAEPSRVREFSSVELEVELKVAVKAHATGRTEVVLSLENRGLRDIHCAPPGERGVWTVGPGSVPGVLRLLTADGKEVMPLQRPRLDRPVPIGGDWLVRGRGFEATVVLEDWFACDTVEGPLLLVVQREVQDWRQTLYADLEVRVPDVRNATVRRGLPTED
jgi:hypothetical protein